ncbi:MAG TPA: diacylglycerol kinase family protein [Gemmatimonadales bacterium]|jgi:YegS/Rv2252/BmrU family lipid kinase|nr:diacylglycerol kinase family protein [Gemmatimonadales bacterium]
MARVLLITNPAAARSHPKVIRAVCDVLARRGLQVDVAGTTKPDDAGTLAHQGVLDGFEIIAVYGGDGTTMRAVRGIVGQPVMLGLIPGGTGNLLAGNLRVPRSPVQAAKLLALGRPRAIDLGRVERPDGIHYFAVNCGAGFDAELMAATSERAKRRWGIGAYVAEAWQRLGAVASYPHRIVVDDVPLETKAATVLVANCGEVIPRFVRLKADIAPDDGLLDVVVLSADGAVDGVGVFWRLLSGSADGDKRIEYARGHRVTIEATPARPVQLDGESAGATPVLAEVMPGAIRVLVPAGD